MAGACHHVLATPFLQWAASCNLPTWPLREPVLAHRFLQPPAHGEKLTGCQQGPESLPLLPSEGAKKTQSLQPQETLPPTLPGARAGGGPETTVCLAEK